MDISTIWCTIPPDLNPLDYLFRSEVENNMNITPFMSLESFKNEIKNGFSRVSLQSIKNAVSTLTTRVRKVEEIKGEYLEKRKINKN